MSAGSSQLGNPPNKFKEAPQPAGAASISSTNAVLDASLASLAQHVKRSGVGDAGRRKDQVRPSSTSAADTIPSSSTFLDNLHSYRLNLKNEDAAPFRSRPAQTTSDAAACSVAAPGIGRHRMGGAAPPQCTSVSENVDQSLQGMKQKLRELTAKTAGIRGGSEAVVASASANLGRIGQELSNGLPMQQVSINSTAGPGSRPFLDRLSAVASAQGEGTGAAGGCGTAATVHYTAPYVSSSQTVWSDPLAASSYNTASAAGGNGVGAGQGGAATQHRLMKENQQLKSKVEQLKGDYASLHSQFMQVSVCIKQRQR